MTNTPSLPALESSLAWVDHYTGQRDPRYFHVCTLAAAVRELRGHHDDDCACAIGNRHEWFIAFCEWKERTERAEAALAAVRGRGCGTCCYHDAIPGACEEQFHHKCEKHDGLCEDFGNTCGAYAAKEQA
jgi:hypothetical protein